MASERQARLADRIRVLIAERLEKGLRDPRLGFVTITDVRVTGDLQTKYTVTTRGSVRGGPRGDTTLDTTVTGQYVGACPAGVRPGDLTTDGNTRNVLAARGGGGGGGRPGGGGGAD